mmetsp:Transcript_15138/g.43418  ORF Transcript_15138/g.43418 Transcript_15138/m.43418 type:complete len:255 (+) Transcript_15138:1071-1835(+)
MGPVRAVCGVRMHSTPPRRVNSASVARVNRYEPFGVNPRTREQYAGRDTFDIALLGYSYPPGGLYTPASLQAPRPRGVLLPGSPGPVELAGPPGPVPASAVFRDVVKLKVDGSKALFVYASDADASGGGGLLGWVAGSLGSPREWRPPKSLADQAPEALQALPGFVGAASLFCLPTADVVKCDNCLRNAPTTTASVDITRALAALRIPRERVRLHAVAYDIATKTAMTLEAAGVPQPILSDCSSHVAEEEPTPS